MGKLMNWLYFSTSDLKVCGSRNSCASSFRNRLTVVPRLSVGPRGSSTMVNSLALDSQMYCLSSLCLEVTTTVSATVCVQREEGREEKRERGRKRGREGGRQGGREEEREEGRKRGRERGRKRGREGERKREMGVRDGGREGGYKGCLDVYGQEKSYPPRKEE